jgi:hypothetical protein
MATPVTLPEAVEADLPVLAQINVAASRDPAGK